ncbi:MAG: hypothetical protein C0592_00685 [Marinilabiliales bacterium]|nr:MAG: hypothetical protein C0592_00685 [Marinilabiliales bacterium]
MKTKVLILLFVLGIVSLSSCFRSHRIEGNLDMTTMERNLPVFTQIENNGSLDVTYIADTAYFVVIEAESNLIPYIETDVYGSELRIRVAPRRNIDPNYPIMVYVHAPMVNSIHISGSGTVVCDTVVASYMDVKISGSGQVTMPVICNNLNARISGSGDVFLSGTADRGDFDISGSGNIYSYNLQQSECIADISGSGNMYLNVSDFLDVRITGSGDVYYIGTPAVSTSITGSGSVIHQ